MAQKSKTAKNKAAPKSKTTKTKEKLVEAVKPLQGRTKTPHSAMSNPAKTKSEQIKI